MWYWTKAWRNAFLRLRTGARLSGPAPIPAISFPPGLRPISRQARDEDNLIRSTVDGRGNQTDFSYDDQGNLTSISDETIRGPIFPAQKFAVGQSPKSVASSDFNGDGAQDIADLSGPTSMVAFMFQGGPPPICGPPQ